MRDTKKPICERCGKDAQITSYLDGCKHFCMDCYKMHLEETLKQELNKGNSIELK